MPAKLGLTDVQRLLTDPVPEVRADVARKIALDLETAGLSSGERVLAEDIVRRMSQDMAELVRRTISENLKASSRLPHDVALRLARDVEAVALPVLEHSLLLTDQDLVSIIEDSGAEKHQAVAKRVMVSEAVSNVLVEKGSEETVAVLVKNEGAQISDQSMNRVVDRFGDRPMVQQPLVMRQRIPITVAERMVALVSDSLRQHLVTHHELPPQMAADIVLQSRERTTVGLVNVGTSPQEIEQLVRQLHSNKRLTPSLIIRALCVGDILFFETALAVRAELPVLNAAVLIHEKGEAGLRALYQKAALPPSLFDVVKTAVQVIAETQMTDEPRGKERYRRTIIERVLTQAEDLGPDDVDYLVAKMGDMFAGLQARA